MPTDRKQAGLNCWFHRGLSRRTMQAMLLKAIENAHACFCVSRGLAFACYLTYSRESRGV